MSIDLSRRFFLKTAALLGGSAAFPRLVEAQEKGENLGEYPLTEPEHMIFSVCQQCNTQCGIKVKLIDGVAVKIDGNPYSPWTLCPHVSYKTPLRQAAAIDGGLCPKGQAGIQTAYDPYRLRVVLKRKPGSKRGENQWVTIPFEQAIREIVEGGDLFGEGHVQGLRELWALRDPKVMAAMGDFVKRLWAEKDKAKKKALVDEFKQKFADHLPTLIDPDHPDLGPKNNQVVFMWGRLKAGRGDFISRFIKDGFGSVNAHGHTTVCQGSLYFAGKAMSEQFVEGKFSGGAKFYWQADLLGSEFVIFVGSSPFEANYGPPYRTNKITEGLVSGRLKFAVIDPRFSKTAAKAWKWLPNKPGTEGAIAMAMIRWMIENRRYDEVYLRNANKAAAKAVGEPTWTNAVWLVKIGDDGTPGAFLRASEIGLTKKRETEREGKKVTLYLTPDGKELAYDLLVTMVDGKPVAFDPNDETNPVVGDLFVDTYVAQSDRLRRVTQSDRLRYRVKSALQILKESAEAMTLEQ
ncbi:MAG: molybdopterin-dependent oxidoreductase, partial [candidate division KSB1 bacterium]|nr:molybdopterin-dependent oxidoreductase [candidate division KSB1 bacterium]